MSAGEAGEAERAAELAAHGLQRGAPLGRGSFGTVYGGRDVLAGGEPVALKYLPVSTSDVERLTTEVGVLSHLSHPHIVCLRRVVRLQASLVVVMQRAFGGDLRALLERAPGGVLGEDQTRRILRQLARGLRYAHSKKVIHRDLKLENVLIKGGEEPDHVLLADFGLSQLGHGRMTESLLSRSGSLYYMVRRRRPCSALHPFPAPHPPPPLPAHLPSHGRAAVPRAARWHGPQWHGSGRVGPGRYSLHAPHGALSLLLPHDCCLRCAGRGRGRGAGRLWPHRQPQRRRRCPAHWRGSGGSSVLR